MIRAGGAAVDGPEAGRVLFAGLSGSQLVRTLPEGVLGRVEVPPGGFARTAVVWDARDLDGEPVPAETYTLEVELVTGGETVIATTVLQLEQR